MSWKRADLKPEYSGSTSMNLGRIQHDSTVHTCDYITSYNVEILLIQANDFIYSYSRQSKYEKPTWMLVIVLVVLNLASRKGV